MRILVIDSNQKMRVELHRVLEGAGWRVLCAWDAEDVAGLLSTKRESIDIAVVDMAMLGPDADLLRIVKEKHPLISFVLKPSTEYQGPIPEGHSVVPAPFDVVTIVATVENVRRGLALAGSPSA